MHSAKILLIMENVSAIKAIDLTKRFGKRVAVDRLNIDIHPGELYALLGDNGAGKTTTLNMLTTLLKPSAGEFYICGYNGITHSEETKGVFSVVSQDVAIYNELTAYENLQFIASLYGLEKEKAQVRIQELLAQADLSDRANDLVSTFSGGMQRKLTIAIALLHKPAVLFMDEPTVGLDPAARRQIWATLSNLREEGVTILLTTHYLEEAEILADRIGIIRQGKLVAEGTIDELRDRIKAIRNVEVRLDKRLAIEEINTKIAHAHSILNMQVSYDNVHNTILFVQSEETKNGTKLISCLEHVLSWLKEENMTFTSFSTNEPSLEEVFLAMTKQAVTV